MVMAFKPSCQCRFYIWFATSTYLKTTADFCHRYHGPDVGWSHHLTHRKLGQVGCAAFLISNASGQAVTTRQTQRNTSNNMTCGINGEWQLDNIWIYLPLLYVTISFSIYRIFNCLCDIIISFKRACIEKYFSIGVTTFRFHIGTRFSYGYFICHDELICYMTI